MRQLCSVEQVKGAFHGWKGNTIVELTNGQKWEQSEYSYHYFYFYCPEAKIYTNNGSYEMEIVGTNCFIPVKKV